MSTRGEEYPTTNLRYVRESVTIGGVPTHIPRLQQEWVRTWFEMDNVPVRQQREWREVPIVEDGGK